MHLLVARLPVEEGEATPSLARLATLQGDCPRARGTPGGRGGYMSRAHDWGRPALRPDRIPHVEAVPVPALGVGGSAAHTGKTSLALGGRRPSSGDQRPDSGCRRSHSIGVPENPRAALDQFNGFPAKSKSSVGRRQLPQTVRELAALLGSEWPSWVRCSRSTPIELPHAKMDLTLPTGADRFSVAKKPLTPP